MCINTSRACDNTPWPHKDNHKWPLVILCMFTCISPSLVCVWTLQVAIKKVLQDKRFKNRELQIMKQLRHPNIVALRHYFMQNGNDKESDEVRGALFDCLA